MASKTRRTGDFVKHGHGVSRQLVSPTLQSPLGILDTSTLQLLLSSSPRHAAGPERPPSSEQQRAYGDPLSPAHDLRLHHQSTRQSKRQRKQPPAKLLPMGGATSTSPAGPWQQRSADTTCARHTAPPRPTHPIEARVAKALFSLDVGNNPVRAGRTRTRNPVTHPPPLPLAPESHVSAPTDTNLRREIQWIHAHLPVRRLANVRCSRALRARLVVDTLHTNLVRASLRDALVTWKRLVTKQKDLEASRSKSVHRLIALFTSASHGHIARRVDQWKRWVQECIDQERLAAAIAMQQWYTHWRDVRAARGTRAAMSLERAHAVAAQMATRIQSANCMHLAKRSLRQSLSAVVRIQRCMRRVWRQRRDAADAAAAAKTMQQLFEQVQHEQRLLAIIGRSRAQQATKIQQCWREYNVWRVQLVIDCVAGLVDDVEFFAAVRSIQSHIRGYQCRFRMKRKLHSARRIQQAWRWYRQRCIAREEHKMRIVQRRLAASCLQRTFQRNRERKRHRSVMQKSTRPMYLRALGQSGSFREQYMAPILKSAAVVIQSSWRRHVRNVKWKQRREAASARIVRWCRRTHGRLRWLGLLNATCHQRRQVAAMRIHAWVLACVRRALHTEQALSTQQLAHMLAAVLTLQRYHRNKRDRWRRVVREVLTQQLPRWRAASVKIECCWRRYCSKKHHRLHTGTEDRARHLHELEAQLREQQQLQAQQDAAARRMQRAFRCMIDRRHRKLLFKRYRILFQQELRRKQQRQVIHGFLQERNAARVKKKEERREENETKTGEEEERHKHRARDNKAIAGADLNDAVTTTPQTRSPIKDHGEIPGVVGSDDPDVVRGWSDEFQCFYLYNSRTGESSWC